MTSPGVDQGTTGPNDALARPGILSFANMPANNRIRVGQIVGAFGLKGQVKVDPLTDFVERLEKGHRLFLKDGWVEVEKCAWHKNRPVLKLSGIGNVEAAKALQWEYLEALAERPPLDEDEFLTEDLIGMKVFDKDGEPLGEVDEVLAYPAHDTLQVGEILIPVVKQFVKRIDLEKGRIDVELIPGMKPGDKA